MYKSARNIDGVKVLPAAEFNSYTVLKQKRLVLTKAALEVAAERSGEGEGDSRLSRLRPSSTAPEP